MVQLANRVEVLELLEHLAEFESELTPNELEMFASIQAKYEEPGAESFDDKTCLEVMIRNVGIRRSAGMKPSEAAVRKIDLPTNGNDAT
ncbi:MAG: hypothetical protein ACRBCJ_07540 [Hyphomicrobiaceae bacterium]